MSDSESSTSRVFENIDSQQDIKEGNTFKDYESFEICVKNYSKNKGFTVRLDTAKYYKETGEIRWREIVCSKSGLPRKNKQQQTEQIRPTRNRSSQRCNCSFFIRGIKSEDRGLWVVAKINLTHNHELVPSQLRKFMPDSREISDDVKDKILELHMAGINVARIRNIIQYDQPNETYLYDDIYNFIYNHGNGSTKEKIFDAQNFVTLLEQHKIENNEFTYIVKVDSNTKEFESAIWMFSEQKMYYSRFSDVVVFDNTYRTNRFDLPFGIFTGVNNYGQSVCFAGALIKSETTEDFIWLFNSFLELVNYHAPNVLLTDNDSAIGSAFSVTFNNHETKHRLCQWHLIKNITTNLMSKLGSNWKSFLKNFYNCLHETKETKFNSAWDSLKLDFSEAAPYLKTLEKHKEKWAMCFNQNVFMAEMSTTQRAESMNNLMKGYINATTSMSTFLNAFESALDSRQQTVEFSRYKECTLNLIYKTPSLFEKQAATILTIYALKKFQEQLLQSSCYKCEEITSESDFSVQLDISNNVNPNLQIFLVTRFESSSDGRIVEYSSVDDIFTCTCGYMVFSGIICRHILRAATQLNIDSFSKKMYISRWCKDPNESEIMQIYQSFYAPLHNLHEIQYSTIEQPQLEQDYKYKFNRTIWKLQQFVNQRPETAQIFDESISLLLNAQITATIGNNPTNATNANNNSDIIIKMPQNVKAKGGVRSNKRKKSGMEINNSQKTKSKKSKKKNSNENKENIMIGNDKENSSAENERNNSIVIPETCPYCDEKLPSPLPNKLKDLFMEFHGKILEAVDQFEFCRIHIAETKIIPDGVEKGYLMEIDFDAIPKRVEKFKSDLLDICKKKIKSFYRDNVMRAYRDMGKSKVNMPMNIMSRFESFQPGYYGPRGAIVIAEALRKLFIDTKILTKSLATPQTPMQYLQEVLVPEVAVRLIQEDNIGITIEKAREIMLESVKFGEYVHNDENQEI